MKTPLPFLWRFLAICLPVVLLSSILSGQATYVFSPDDDDYTEDAIFDLRRLNEDVAGENGWVRLEGDQLIRGDGQPIRFWGLTSGVPATYEATEQMVRFLAKRGVNLIRYHTTVFDDGADTPNPRTLVDSKMDELHRLVAAAKEEGVYTKISHFFVLSYTIRASWGLEGITEDYDQPFGAVFFWDEWEDIFKDNVIDMMTRPNPYEPSNTTLAQDRSVAYLEIQNEDNVFFFTFDPFNMPDIVRQHVEEDFYDFLIRKYGTIAAAQDTWGPLTSAYVSTFLRNADDPDNQRMAVSNAFTMSTNAIRNANDKRRLFDQVEFLNEMQFNFYDSFNTLFREELNSDMLLTASNWRTVDDSNLQDLEYYTYSANQITDNHNYYSPVQLNRSGNQLVAIGDTVFSQPGPLVARRLPTNIKQVEGRATNMSETTWTHFNEYRAEAPYLVAAYAAMNDIDGWQWFAYDATGTWHSEERMWATATPSQLGLWPGASLMYRRGDLAKANTVVREGRTLESIYNIEQNIIRQTPGFDPTRDPDQLFNYDPSANEGQLDPLTFLTGKVEIGYDTDIDFVSPQIEESIDENDVVTSVTGEIVMDPVNVLFTINAPRAQGAAGEFSGVSRIETDNFILRSENEYGSFLGISLDDHPISQSSQVLLQFMTLDTTTGWETAPWNTRLGVGHRVINPGVGPWNIIENDTRVTLRNVGNVESVQVLDAQGYIARNIIGQQLSEGYRITVPVDAMYIVVNMTAPDNYVPVVATKVLPNARIDTPYMAKLDAISGDGDHTWAITAGDLPSGLTLNANGTISGTTSADGRYQLTLEVTDADSDTATQVVDLFVLELTEPTPSIPSIYGEPGTTDLGDGFKWNAGLSFLYDDLYPFVYTFSLDNWFWVFDPGDGSVTEAGGYYLWDFAREAWGWTSTATYPFYIALSGSDVGNPVLLGPLAE